MVRGPGDQRFALSRERLVADVLLLIFVVALPIGFASTPNTFEDGDVSWHIAAGRWMLAHHAIPATDPFSFTAYGHPWIAMEWLAELIYATAYNVAGFSGLAAVVAAAFAVLHAIFFLQLRRYVGPLGMSVSIIAADLVLMFFIVARPHVLVWPILAGWTALLLRSLETKRPPPWWSLLLLVAWTNMHASFPLAMLIAGGVAIDAVIEANWKNWREWTLFLAASAIALTLNANGLRGVLQPFQIAGLKMLPTILEWQPSTPTLTPIFYMVLLLGLGAALWRGVRITAGRILILLVLLALAFHQVRHQSWFVIVATLMLPPLFQSGGSMRVRVAPFLMGALLLVIIRAWLPILPNEGSSNPRHLLAAVPPELRSRPVLNGYSFGGPLILAGIRPYIDGRAEMYGDAFYADYLRMTDGDINRFDRAVRLYDIRWTMLPKSNAKLIGELDASKSWRRIYSDGIGVIHIRRD